MVDQSINVCEVHCVNIKQVSNLMNEYTLRFTVKGTDIILNINQVDFYILYCGVGVYWRLEAFSVTVADNELAPRAVNTEMHNKAMGLINATGLSQTDEDVINSCKKNVAQTEMSKNDNSVIARGPSFLKAEHTVCRWR